jgi:hypothetical protein
MSDALGIIALVGMFALVLALSLGILAAIGFGCAWVLGHFGVHMEWYVCSVAVFLFGFITRNVFPSKK